MRVSKDQIDSYFKNLSLINETMPVGIKLITAQKLMVELTNELLRRDDNSSQQAFIITSQLNKLCKSYKKNSQEFKQSKPWISSRISFHSSWENTPAFWSSHAIFYAHSVEETKPSLIRSSEKLNSD